LNALQKEIGLKKKVDMPKFSRWSLIPFIHHKNKEDATELIAKKSAIDEEIAQIKLKETEAENIMRAKAATIGNLVHDSVTVSLSEVSEDFC
jgi:seryl-tRNA synthetase